MRKRWKYPELTEGAKRKILGQNAAHLYGLPPAAEASPHGLYTPVPRNFQQMLDAETKRIMEFPANWVPCNVNSDTEKDSCSQNPLAINDNFTKMKKVYAEAGGRPDNIRRGWLRTRL